MKGVGWEKVTVPCVSWKISVYDAFGCNAGFVLRMLQMYEDRLQPYMEAALAQVVGGQEFGFCSE